VSSIPRGIVGSKVMEIDGEAVDDVYNENEAEHRKLSGML